MNNLEIYGALKEGVHIAGYTLERAFGNLKFLLQDDRWKLDGGFNDVNAFIDSIRLDKFKILTEQRKDISAQIRKLQPEISNSAMARMLGVDRAATPRSGLATSVRAYARSTGRAA
jgi:hypothetical protein